MIRKMLAVAVIVGTPIPFHSAKAETLKQSVKCLADNIYFEARDDGPAGWSAGASAWAMDSLKVWFSASSRPISELIFSGDRFSSCRRAGAREAGAALSPA